MAGNVLSDKAVDELKRMYRTTVQLLGRVKPSQRRRNITAGGGNVRRAYCKTDAPVDNKIQCYLDDWMGTEVTVYCSTIGPNAGDLSEMIPRLSAADVIFVVFVGTAWWCTTIFQSSQDCTCI